MGASGLKHLKRYLAHHSRRPLGTPPLLPAPRSAGRGLAVAPQSATASSTDSPRLFDRSAQREGSFAVQPTTEHRRLPVGTAGGSLAAGAAFSPSFLAAQKGRSPAGAKSRHLRAAQTASAPIMQKAKTAPFTPPLPPAVEGENTPKRQGTATEETTNLRAASAHPASASCLFNAHPPPTSAPPPRR